MCLHHVLGAEKRCIDINKDDPSFYPCTLLALQFHQFFFDRLMSEDSAKKIKAKWASPNRHLRTRAVSRVMKTRAMAWVKKTLKNDDPGHNLFSGRVGFLPVGYSNELRH